MTLEQAWLEIEKLNKSIKINNDVEHNYICLHSQAFRSLFSRLNTTKKIDIFYWLRNDDEFLDYFVCLYDKSKFDEISSQIFFKKDL